MKLIKGFVFDIIDKVNHDHLGAYASQAAYFIILSALPFAIFVLSIIQYSPLSYDDVLTVLKTLIPGVSSDYVDGMLQQIYERSTIAITSFTILFVLWSAGRALFTIANGLNEIYRIKETRNYFHLRFNAMIYTMMLAIGLIFIMMLLLFGKKLFRNVVDMLPFHRFFFFILSIRLLIIFILLTIGLIFIYRVLPNTQTKILEVLPGAVSVSIGWIITSYLFAFFFSYTNSFSYMYGSLTGIMVIMLWLYFCAFQLFLGAELNYTIRHGSESAQQLHDILDKLD